MLTATIDETLPIIEEDQIDGWEEFPENYFGEENVEEEEDEDDNKPAD